jgi:tRNA/rRNA methyltransferase
MNFDKSLDLDKLKSNDDSLSLQNAPVEAIETYYDRLESLLLEIGYLYPHTAATRMAKIRRLYNRVNLKSEELSMLRGMLRQIHWAVEKK